MEENRSFLGNREEKVINVLALVIVEKRRALLLRHGDDGLWKFCGGRIADRRITLLESARSEAIEEIGTDIEFVNHEPFMSHVAIGSANDKVDIFIAHFLAKRLGEIGVGEKIKEYKWVDLSSLGNFTPRARNVTPALEYFGYPVGYSHS
jgi:8-oxo-dGTP pyrophosphatase MutT (NUDIX family)